MDVASSLHRVEAYEYKIDAFAVQHASCMGYSARVVVRQSPGMRELYRQEGSLSGQLWPDPQAALAAGLARGQQLARAHLCGTNVEVCGRIVLHGEEPFAAPRGPERRSSQATQKA